jgi:transcriptional regulator with XRE-family HTH domain
MNQTDGPSLLDTAIKKRKISYSAAALQLGVNKSTISVWLHGVHLPSAAMRDVIEAWSGGSVPSSSWLSATEKKAIARARRASGAP